MCSLEYGFAVKIGIVRYRKAPIFEPLGVSVDWLLYEKILAFVKQNTRDDRKQGLQPAFGKLPEGRPDEDAAACAQMLSALKRNKMMEAIAGRIPVRLSGLFHALGHHLSGGFFVVRFFFFFFFTVDANDLMVDDR